MEIGKIEIPYRIFDSTQELPLELQTLVLQAKDASLDAHCPYSKFRVGAAVLLDNGAIITGNNQENAAYPSGLCAERVAIFAAKSQYPNNAIQAIAVYGNPDYSLTRPIAPCGACRQVMIEYQEVTAENVCLVMAANKSKIIVVDDVKNLLPFLFSSDYLKIEP